ncbi:MAG TPA: hypothetical protein VEB20_02175 [Azospirillaceae bacterium]|nr:hypothetical protein [Azospirillaceae bacterium]
MDQDRKQQKDKDDVLHKQTPQQEGPTGDSGLADEAAKDGDVDRSKTPGKTYDV